MKDKILKKLGSEKGASITFALLLFLVCSVLCSVIIASATAASGRMSRIAETDQRYYSVTSAAELLKDLINGKTVSIVKVETRVKNTKYTSSGSREDADYGDPTTVTYLVDSPMSEIDDSKLILANSIENITLDSIQKDAAYRISRSAASGSEQILTDRELTLTPSFSVSGLAEGVLQVTIKETLYKNGKMTFTLYNAFKDDKKTASAPGDQYRLFVTFGADESTVVSEKEADAAPSPVSGGGYTVQTTKTTMTTTTLTWRFLDIKTAD